MRDHRKHDIPDIAGQQITVSKFRFGGSSDFGFKNPFRFFDLPAIRSESHHHQVRKRVGRVGYRSAIGSTDRKLFTLLKLSAARSVRAWDSESLGRRFKSYRAHQTHRNPDVMTYAPRDFCASPRDLMELIRGEFRGVNLHRSLTR